MVDYQFIYDSDHPYIECLPGGERIESEQDALDLVGACGEHRAQRLLLHAENLTDDFYKLKTGLAGAVLLKFSNYRIKTAIVLEPERMAGRFAEMALEANRSNRDFHVFYERSAAVAWLVKD